MTVPNDNLNLSGAKRRKLRFAACLLFSFFVLLLDYETKEAVISRFAVGDFLPVTPFFNLCHLRNTGAAFSFLSDAGGWQSTFFIVLSLTISVLIVFWLWREKTVFPSLGLSLILAGALGNCLDRVFRGSVVDFLDFHINALHWPAFNVADIAICLGALILILRELFKKER